MSTDWSSYHPNYDYVLKNYALVSETYNKLLQEIPNVQKKYMVRDVTVYMDYLRYINEYAKRDLARLKGEVNKLEEKYQAILPKIVKTPYPKYKDDIRENLKTLASRLSEYKAQFRAQELIKKSEDFKTWYLDKNAVQLEPYKPLIRLPITVARKQKQGLKKAVIIKTPTKVKSAKVQLFYADSGDEPIRNRLIFYWKYDKKEPEKLDGSPSRALMLPVGVGRTDKDGFLSQTVPFKSNKLIIENGKIEFKSDVKIADLLENANDLSVMESWLIGDAVYSPEVETELEKHIEISKDNYIIGDETILKNKYNAYIKATADDFAIDAEYGFMVYPLSIKAFKTIDVKKIAELPAPKYFGWTDLKYATRHKITETNKVQLHCTLPEWEFRLKEALQQLRYWMELRMAGHAPHLVKNMIAKKMLEVTQLNIDYPWEEQKTPNIKAKTILKKNLNIIDKNIEKILDQEKDLSACEALKPLTDVQKKIEEKAKELWDILSNEAFRKEVDSYLQHAAKQMKNLKGKAVSAKNFKVPTGPLMEEEDWETIIMLIGECYSSISVGSDKLGEKIAEREIVPWVEYLGSHEVVKQAFSNCEKYLKLADKEVFEDYQKDAKFKEMVKDISNVKKPEKKDSLLFTIMDGYEAIVTAYKDHVKDVFGYFVPAPGPNNMMQIILDAYGKQINAASIRALEQNSSQKYLHVRLMVRYFDVLGLTWSQKARQNIYSSFMTSLLYSSMYRIALPSDLETDESSRSTQNSRLVTAMHQLKKIIEGHFEKTERSEAYSEYIYGKIPRYAALTGRSVYVVLNTSVVFFNLIGNFEKYKKTGDLEYILRIVFEDFAGIIYSGATSAMVVKRILGHDLVRGTVNYGKYQSISKFANVLGEYLNVVGFTFAFYDAYKLSGKAGLESEKWWKVAEGTTLLMLSLVSASRSAFIRGLAGRFIIRFFGGVLVTLLSAAHLNVVGAIVGFLAVVGSILLLIVDLLKLLGMFFYWLFASDEYKFMADKWEAFEAKIPDDMAEKIMPKDPLAKDAWENYINWHPYEAIYTSDDNGGLQELVEINSSIEVVDEYRKKWSDWFDSGVNWSKLTWRAIVPMSMMKYPKEVIEKLVEFPEASGYTSKLCSVNAILEYYKEIENDPVNHKELEEYYKGNRPKSLSKGTVAHLLRKGIFNPVKGMQFYRSEDWEHPYFWISSEYSKLGIKNIFNKVTEAENQNTVKQYFLYKQIEV